MLDKIAPKTRMYILLGLLAVTALVTLVYVRRTLDLFSKISTLEQKTSMVATADRQLQVHQEMLNALDSRILQVQQVHVQIESHVQFLDYMENLCKKHELRLLSLPQERVDTLDRYQIASIRFKLEGSYHHLTQMIYELEQVDRVASLSHCELRQETIREMENKKTILVAEIEVNRMLKLNEDEDEEGETDDES
jgi:Tfp pilus assembly protein PilO